MEFLKPFLEKMCDGIISTKYFPDIIRNGMQHPELSVFGGGSDLPRVWGVSIGDKAIGSSREQWEESLKKLTLSNINLNIKIIKTPIDVIKRDKLDLVIHYDNDNNDEIKKSRKTRRLKRK